MPWPAPVSFSFAFLACVAIMGGALYLNMWLA